MSFMEKGGTFLPVCYEQTTRQVPPFYAIDRGKIGLFQPFLPLFLQSKTPPKRIMRCYSNGYRNASIFAYLQPTCLLVEKSPFYRGTLSEIFIKKGKQGSSLQVLGYTFLYKRKSLLCCYLYDAAKEQLFSKYHHLRYP